MWAADKLVDESSRHMMTKEGEGGPGANMSGGLGGEHQEHHTCEFRRRSCKMGGGADTLRRRAVKYRGVLLDSSNFVRKIL